MLAHPDATFFHLSGWRRFVQRVYGNTAQELYAWRGDELVGVLPMMLAPRLAGRKRLVSVPFGVYGGPVGASPEIVMLLIEEAERLAERLRVSFLELRCLHDPGVELPGSELYATFIRELPEDPAQVLARMPKKSRAEARKAREKHGLELGQGNWYVDDLHRLFLANKHQLGSPGLPHRHFTGLLEGFGKDVTIHLVRHGSDPLAAVMSFRFRDTLIAYYSGTAPGADRSFSASNFMFMALQEWAVRSGLRFFDFCRSRCDSGAYQFKRHQGFEPLPLQYRFHLVRARSLPAFTPSNPRTAVLRNTWARLPLSMARRLSGMLARYLS